MDVSDEKHVYPLNRDFLASTRLNLQHHVWMTSLGYLLHPKITVKQNVAMADVGCGTGISTVEMTNCLPTGSSITGFDLSLAQCPPRAWWPSNVTFNELDIFASIPEPLVGKFDIVYIRHFICVVQSGDPMPLLTALLTLLRPGGYLQWQEWDLETNKLVLANPSVPAPKMQAFLEFGQQAPGRQTSWVKTFHERFAEAGAELIAHERHWTSKGAFMMKQDISFLGPREWCENLRAREPESDFAAKLEKLTNEAFGECSRQYRGSVVDCEMVTWVARKK